MPCPEIIIECAAWLLTVAVGLEHWVSAQLTQVLTVLPEPVADHVVAYWLELAAPIRQLISAASAGFVATAAVHHA
ncbi:MAG: hypothetical protein AAGH76_03600 [Pseudomonadota bacterium]